MRHTLAALLICLGLPLHAQNAEVGEKLFTTHCATCHGVGAQGDGPMANMILIQPHGSPMPVYGDFFEGWDVAVKSETGQPIMTSLPIVDLLAYLASVQR